MRHFLTVCLLFLLAGVEAQEYRQILYQSYLNEEMESWKGVIDQMEQDYTVSSDPKLLYDLLETEYGYTAWLVSVKRKKEVKDLLAKAEGHMALLIEKGLGSARVYSLKGAFYGFQIMMEPQKAPKLGRLSMEANEKALELDPEEPQAWLEKANNQYHRPPIFGGSKRKAVPVYEKAVELFEKSAARTQKNWVYMNCLVSMAIAYENTKHYSEAGELYRKILKKEPSFKLVRDELYPHFQEKHPGN